MSNPQDFLKNIGKMADIDFPLFDAALCLAEINHVGRSTEKYKNHIHKMAHQVGARYDALINAGAKDDIATKIASLKHVICDENGYHCAIINYNDMRNADIIDTIDRREGLPITIAIIALECAWTQGWNVCGINFPGHFLIRFEESGERVLSDPSQQFKIMHAADLRNLIKKLLGRNAELSPNFYQEVSKREILLRLQNNIKFKQIEGEFYAEALKTVNLMREFAPNEHRILLDESVLNARLGRINEAINAVNAYLRADLSPKDRNDAEILLKTLELQL